MAIKCSRVRIAKSVLAEAIRTVLRGERIERASISLAVVDDATIHELNRRYLDHDYATDVLSFVLSDDPQHLEGEIIVSAERAAELAPSYGWTPASELTLYVIHGTLHLAGYDDHDPQDVEKMRHQEREYLQQLGIEVPKNTTSG